MICSYLPILYCLPNLLGHQNPSHQFVCQDITLWHFYMHMSIISM
ncbi:hypothetical protein IHE45_10G022200 [Dioscorea alata]|uniref:Uncharacterized protein n=1 Tax=Dioscorea alata TaxID=55571 RepID=A0ACB7V9V0_DIOAL|nr:hypothetical protein IHE45_10G022200 [Dioscorea alata]